MRRLCSGFSLACQKYIIVNDQKSISRIPHQFSAVGYVNILNINGRLTHLNVPLQAQKQSRKGHSLDVDIGFLLMPGPRVRDLRQYTQPSYTQKRILIRYHDGSHASGYSAKVHALILCSLCLRANALLGIYESLYILFCSDKVN